LVMMGVCNFIDPVMDDRILLKQIFKTPNVWVDNEYNLLRRISGWYQPDATEVIHWRFFSSTCFGRLRPSSGAQDVD
jgi:hypothetical protein